MLEVVYLLLTLTCEGHTNAACAPTIRQFETKAECELARFVPEKKGLFGHSSYINPYTVCFPSVKE